MQFKVSTTSNLETKLVDKELEERRERESGIMGILISYVCLLKSGHAWVVGLLWDILIKKKKKKNRKKMT